MKNKIKKIAYVLSHPIQYQYPLLKKLSTSNKFELNTFFLSDHSVKDYFDKDFGKKIKWNINILSGYNFTFLKNYFNKNKISFFSPIVLDKKIFEILKYDYIWFHGYAHYIQLFLLILCLFFKKKYLLRLESNLVSTNRNFFKDIFIKIIIKKAFKILYIGSLNKEYYLEFGAKLDQLFFVPYTVDNDYFLSKKKKFNKVKIKKSLNLNEDIPIILFSGKLIKRKQPHLLLEECLSLMKIQKFYLIFLGEGDLKQSMINLSKNKSQKKYIRFCGFINIDKISDYYSLSDIFILPSLQETFGLVMNEAMLHANVIVSSKFVGSYRDFINENYNGFTFENFNDLRKKLKILLKDNKKIETFKKNSLKRIKYWNNDISLKSFERIFNDC